jgi:hypothetical protein
MSGDKRRDPRFASAQKLWCEGQGEIAEARNMSKSGMFIVTQGPREIGEQLKVAFEDEQGTIEVKMEVMWCGQSVAGEQTGLGLRIVGFDKGEDAYEKFVMRQLRDQGPSEG